MKTTLQKILKKHFNKIYAVFILMLITNCSGKTSTQDLLAGNFMDPPEITWLYPKQSADGFPVSSSILFSSSLPIDPSVLQSNIILKDEANNIVPVLVQSTGTYGFEVFPQQSLNVNTRYTFTIPSGTQAVGSQFGVDKVLSFSTLAVLQPADSSFGTATNGTSTYVFPEGTTSNNASITFGKSVTGVALSSTSLHIETDTGCMNCATLSGLSGSGAGPYTFTINGLNSGVVYFLKMGNDIKDAEGNSAASSIKFAVAPVVSSVKNLGSRGTTPFGPWGDNLLPPVVTIDPNGNKYVAGVFFGTTDWGGGVRNSDPVNPSLFIVKYDSAGNYVWDRIWSPGSVTFPQAIKADATGVYLLFDYLSASVVTLDTGVSIPATGGLETALIKVVDSVSPVVAWAASFTSGGNNGSTTMEFTPDGILAIYTYGFSAAMTGMSVTPVPVNPVCTLSGYLGFIVGLNPADGSCAWGATPMPVNYVYSPSSGYVVTSIGFDTNSMYLTGFYYGPAGNLLSSTGITAPSYAGGNDIFVARIGYSAAGPDPAAAGSWLATFGSTGFDNGNSLAVDSANNRLYVAGYLQGPSDFGCSQTPCTSVGSAGTEDGFLMAFDTTATNPTPTIPLWAQTIGGTGGNDRSQKVLAYNNRVRVFTRYDMTMANFKTNQFGCAFNNFNGFGNTDLVMSIYDANGTFDGARAFGNPADELLNISQGSYVTQDSTGKMTAVLYMGPGIIDSVPIFSSSNPRDLVMWDLQ